MALIGRKACPWCGFEHAHVKRNEGKFAFHHCPGCGYCVSARTKHQEALLCSGMRPEGAPPANNDAPKPPPTDRPIIVGPPSAPAPAAGPPATTTAAATPAKPAKRAGLWDSLMNKGGGHE